MQEFLLAIGLFLISALFSMFGKGGGELYLPFIITIVDISVYRAAGISLFLIFIQSISMIIIYSKKHRSVDWPVAFLLAAVVGIFAFLGGFVSKGIPSQYLKLTFSFFLIISAIALFLNKKARPPARKFAVWHRKVGDMEYKLDLMYLIVPIAAAAFLAGMIGISGGGLIVPIAVLIGAMPLRIAMGTNTFLVLVSSSMGFFGHLAKGGIDWRLCLIFSIVVIAGSQLGSRLHAKVGEKQLRIGLGAILFATAVWMFLKVFL